MIALASNFVDLVMFVMLTVATRKVHIRWCTNNLLDIYVGGWKNINFVIGISTYNVLINIYILMFSKVFVTVK